MARIQINDIRKPGTKRSIRDVEIKHQHPERDEPETRPHHYEEPHTHKRKINFGAIWLAIGIVAIGAFIFFVMTAFSSASISIHPKSFDINVDINLPISRTEAPDTLKFELITVSSRHSDTLPAIKEEAVETKARGKITIYNTHSTSPQRLMINTRFEASDGRLYRIGESITVPGKSTKSGIEAPGEFTTEIVADEVGEKFNMESGDFKIPGFKSDSARYKGFYAKIVAPIVGGYRGNKKLTEAGAKEALQRNLASSSLEASMRELRAKVPDDLILLDNSFIIATKTLSEKENTSSVTIENEITVSAIALNRVSLSQMITREYLGNVSEWSGLAPYIKEFSGLTVAKLPAFETGTTTPEIGLSGQAKAFATVDSTALAGRLAGQPKSSLSRLINTIPGIEKVTASIKPVWKNSFPSDSKRIHMQINTY